MSALTPDQLKRLAAVGVTLEQLAVMVAVMDERDDALLASCPVKPERSKEATRSQRYRDRVKAGIVTPKHGVVTTSVTVEPMGGRGESSFLLSQQDSGKEDSGSVVAREPDEVEQLRDLWNETAEELGLAKVQHLSEARRKSARKRLAECGGMEGMRYAMAQIRASPGLQGKAGGRAWKADFDWLLQPSSFTKLMEGKYDHWQKPKSDLMAAADRLRERVGAGHRENAQGGRAENGLFDRADGAGEVLDDHLSY